MIISTIASLRLGPAALAISCKRRQPLVDTVVLRELAVFKTPSRSPLMASMYAGPRSFGAFPAVIFRSLRTLFSRYAQFASVSFPSK